MVPPILDVTPTAVRRAVRTPNRMISGLRGDNLLLHARRKLLRLGRRHPQIRDVTKLPAPANSITSTPLAEPSVPVSANRKTHPPTWLRSQAAISHPDASPHFLDTSENMSLVLFDGTAASQPAENGSASDGLHCAH